jgi:hypothetical protein
MRPAFAIAACACLAAFAAHAAAPVAPLANQTVTLDGTPLGSAIANRSSVPTILYDAATATYHLWVEAADESGSGVVATDFDPLRISSFRHATSTDGVAFTSTGALSFSGNPFASTIFGSTFGEPPWIYPRASVWNGSYRLMMWTFNDFFSGTPYPGVFGDYDYNISFNDIGADPGQTSLVHRGPVGPVPGTIPGETAGAFGIVDGVMYYDNNSTLGRAAITDNGISAFPSGYDTGPWQVTGTNASVADPLTPLGLIACEFSGGTVYVHNSARVLDNGDGTLGWFFSLRNCDGTRHDAQVYYMESADGGQSWSAPVGIFAGAATIGGNSLASGYSVADVVLVRGTRVIYFNAQDSEGNLVVGAAPPAPVPTGPAVPMPIAPWLPATLAAAIAALGALALRRCSRPFAR